MGYRAVRVRVTRGMGYGAPDLNTATFVQSNFRVQKFPFVLSLL